MKNLKNLFAHFWVWAIAGRNIDNRLLFLEDILRLLKNNSVIKGVAHIFADFTKMDLAIFKNELIKNMH